ncbi:MAG: hypothetical protein AAGC67_16915 [Myxococcota bacterium]
MDRSALLAMLLLLLACAPAPAPAPAPDATCEALSGEAITALFADVLDRASVRDGQGARATNLWCRDGRFRSRWEGPAGGGEIEGTWWVERDLRCVRVEHGLPDDGDRRRCVPIYRCDDRIVSGNASGGTHGWHALTPADCASFDAPSASASR